MWRLSTADGVTLAGTDIGEGMPIVLLHGLASTHRWWDLVTLRLKGFRVIRFDHRGHGCSGVPLSTYDLAALTSDTLAVLNGLGVARAIVAGHSLGAAVALRVAARHPHRVAALACIDGGVYDPALLFGQTWEQARNVMVKPRPNKITAAVLDAWLAGNTLPREPVLANYRETGNTIQLRLAASHEEQLAHDLWQQDPFPLLQSVKVPALAIAARQHLAAQDVPRHESLERAREMSGDLTVRWIDGGHDLPLLSPDQIAEELSALKLRIH